MLVVCGLVVGVGWFYGGGDLEKLKQQASQVINEPSQEPPAESGPLAVAAADAPQEKANQAAQGTATKQAAPADPKTAPKANGSKELTKEQSKLLDEIRGLMAGRDLPGSKAKLAEAAKLEGSDEFRQQIERLNLVQNYLQQYWDAVWKGAQRVGAKDSIEYKDLVLGVVGFENGTLILRVDGVNRRYTIDTMTRTVSLICASHALDVSSAVNKMIVAVFLTMDGKGDREQAKKYFEEAKRAGLAKDVEILLPELGIQSTALANAQLVVPKNLNRLQRGQLLPANWLVRYPKGGKWQRGPLGNLGSTARVEGWLQITYAGAETDPEIQVVQRTRLTGNFTARFILDGVSDGQKLGLFTAGTDDARCTLDLPLGTAHVEFVRKDGQFVCNVNGEPASVTVSEGADPKMPGFLGFTCTPGTTCTLAYFEFVR